MPRLVMTLRPPLNRQVQCPGEAKVLPPHPFDQATLPISIF